MGQRHQGDSRDAVNYPMIGDPDLHVAKLYDMIHPTRAAESAPRRQRHDPLGVMIGPTRK